MSLSCSHCGNAIKKEARFCNKCGTPTTEVKGATKIFSLLDFRYEILNIVKIGGMGCVYKAKDTRLGSVVAVKKMLPTYTSQEDKKYFEDRFAEEARLLSTLHHSGLPRVSDFFISTDPETGKGALYLVMNFIEGKDLEVIMEERGRKPLTVEDAENYFRQILEVLAYLHSRTPPIIYRDMKPSNIMIQEQDKRAFLVDFGIARNFEPKKQFTMVGTPGYSAPEQYKGFAEPRSDLYSLAVVIHFLLTGISPDDPSYPPFTFPPVRDLNPSVPEYLNSIINSMLDIIIKHRPESAQKVLETLNMNTSLPITLPKLMRETQPLAPSQFDKLIEDYSHEIQSHPLDPILYFYRGCAYSEIEEYKKAILDLDKSIELNPDFDLAYNHRGLAHFYMGEYDKARQDFDKALQLNPANYQAYTHRAEVFIEKGDWDQAISDCEKAININPHHAPAYNRRGEALLGLSRKEPAMEDFDKAIQLDPKYGTAYRNRALMNFKKFQYDSALTDLNKAQEFTPEDPIIYNIRGRIFFERGEYKRAISEFTHAIDLNPKFADAYTNRWEAYRKKGDHERALVDCNKAIDLKPDLKLRFAHAYNQSGLINFYKGDYEQAIADFNKAIQLNPRFMDAYDNRDLVYRRKEFRG